MHKQEYARLSGDERRLIKGQECHMLSRAQNLTLEGRQSLKLLLVANKRLNTAYLLRQSCGKLCDDEREGRAPSIFDNWRSALKWQRLEPYAKFAEMIERHWDGSAAYCHPENKVSLAFVEGLNNKIQSDSASGLWTTGPGVLATQGSHLHAAFAVKSLKSTHSITRRAKISLDQVTFSERYRLCGSEHKPHLGRA